MAPVAGFGFLFAEDDRIRGQEDCAFGHNRSVGGITFEVVIKAIEEEEEESLIQSNQLSKNVDRWCTLQWNCVPGKKDLPNYLYARSLAKAIDLYNSFIAEYIDMGKYNMKRVAEENHPDPIKIGK